MANKRRQHSPEFKFRVALEAAKGLKTTAQRAADSQVARLRMELVHVGAQCGERMCLQCAGSSIIGPKNWTSN